MLTTVTNSTRTLTINPAFLQEIKDDNRHLRDLRTALKALITNTAVLNGHRRRLVTLLNELCDQLAFHFALEEAYGYFDDAVDIAPRLTAIAEKLRSQHSVLFTTLVDIVVDAEDAERNGFPSERFDNIVERVRDFDDALSEHEADETTVIFEAMDRDIGGEG